MKYKVGDRVKIKSLDWYNENKDNNREIKFENGIFTTLKSTFLGQIMTIEEITLEKQYILMEDRYKTLWTDEMIEGLVEEETKFGTASNPIEPKSNANCTTQKRVDEMSLDKAGQITDFEYEGFAYTLPDGYQFVDENGNVINAQKIALEKKRKEYPKTYEECCNVLSLGEDGRLYTKGYKASLIQNFQKLYICRDAYWKLAGEEMGLGKPWEPDWKDGATHKFIIHTIKDKTYRGVSLVKNHSLAFPTEEMRDAFKKNFDPDIEICKELL